jgi:hypothetical protein
MGKCGIELIKSLDRVELDWDRPNGTVEMIVASAVLFEGVEQPLVMLALSKFESLIFEQGDEVAIWVGIGHGLEERKRRRVGVGEGTGF